MGFNPGQWAVKNTLDGASGRPKVLAPFPAVIAPWAKMDDLGLGKKAKVLEATVNGSRYLGGTTAEYHPMAIRQMATGRLDPDSPLYAALVQMSAQQLFAKRNGSGLPRVAIASALPVGWMSDEAGAALEHHIRRGLAGLVDIESVSIKSEPASVVLHEMIDDTGAIRADQVALSKGMVCVADIGGSTLNRSVLDKLQPLPRQSESPYLGSQTAIEQLRQRRGLHQIADAERTLLAALETPGVDTLADQVLREYREAVVAALQQAWKNFNPTAYLIAGGTALWVGEAIAQAFGPKVRIVKNPQQAIATGLWRFVRMQQARKGA